MSIVLRAIAFVLVIYIALCIAFYVRTLMRRHEWGAEFEKAMSELGFKAMVFFYYPIGYIHSCIKDMVKS